MTNILIWILFGAIVGWIASILMGRRNRMGCIGNIIIGILGAVLGGFIMKLIGQESIIDVWSWRSFGVALFGAVVLLGITGWFRRR